MRSMFLTGCLWLLTLATSAQRSNGRIPSGPIKWSMSGSTESMPGDLTHYYSTTDSSLKNNRSIDNNSTAIGGNANATRFASIRANCDNQSMSLNWVAIQQFGADRYEIEQSSDGRNWKVISAVPAKRTEFGESEYSFNYYRNAGNAFFRITATSIGGDRIPSAIIESPCGINSFVGVTLNPVYSSTNVKIGSPSSVKVKLVLLDAGANVIRAQDASLQSGINYIPLDMSSLPRGTYSLVISWFSGKQEIIKLSKQ